MNKTLRYFALNSLCAVLFASAIGVSATAAAHGSKAPSGGVLIVAPVHAAARAADRNLHRVSRYGAYHYAPLVVMPRSTQSDEWADDEDDSDVDEFDATDLDHDGFISFREARRSNPEWARNFRRIDTSGDGYLTREEVEASYAR
jgi:EF hand